MKTSVRWEKGEKEASMIVFYYYVKFIYFSTKTYVVGTQKNRLHETVLLSTKNIF